MFLVQRLSDGWWGAFLYENGKHVGLKSYGEKSKRGNSRMKRLSTAEKAAELYYKKHHEKDQVFHKTIYEG